MSPANEETAKRRLRWRERAMGRLEILREKRMSCLAIQRREVYRDSTLVAVRSFSRIL